MDQSPTTQMPLYQCHKQVWALKIKEIQPEFMPRFKNPTCRGSFMLGSACGHCERCTWEQTHPAGLGAIIVPEDTGFASFRVDKEYLSKHKPFEGGYYVVYKDGYKSFSPADAFEEGYTRI